MPNAPVPYQRQEPFAIRLGKLCVIGPGVSRVLGGADDVSICGDLKERSPVGQRNEALTGLQLKRALRVRLGISQSYCGFEIRRAQPTRPVDQRID